MPTKGIRKPRNPNPYEGPRIPMNKCPRIPVNKCPKGPKDLRNPNLATEGPQNPDNSRPEDLRNPNLATEGPRNPDHSRPEDLRNPNLATEGPRNPDHSRRFWKTRKMRTTRIRRRMQRPRLVVRVEQRKYYMRSREKSENGRLPRLTVPMFPSTFGRSTC
jgi:hypothetical protein